jgi:hypothetical protein
MNKETEELVVKEAISKGYCNKGTSFIDLDGQDVSWMSSIEHKAVRVVGDEVKIGTYVIYRGGEWAPFVDRKVQCDNLIAKGKEAGFNEKQLKELTDMMDRVDKGEDPAKLAAELLVESMFKEATTEKPSIKDMLQDLKDSINPKGKEEPKKAGKNPAVLKIVIFDEKGTVKVDIQRHKNTSFVEAIGYLEIVKEQMIKDASK